MMYSYKAPHIIISINCIYLFFVDGIICKNAAVAKHLYV